MIKSKYYIPETEELSDELVSLRVITDNGPICMTPKEYEKYMQEQESAKTEHYHKLHKHSFANKAELSKAKKCGCFYCCSIYSPSEITEWVEDEKGDTAVCPHCGIDSVIPESLTGEYELTEDLLKEMYGIFFENKS